VIIEPVVALGTPVPRGMLTELVEEGLLTPVLIAPLLPVENVVPLVLVVIAVEVAVARLKKAGNLPAGLTPNTMPL